MLELLMYFLILVAPVSADGGFPDVTKADLNYKQFQSQLGIASL
jgi:hypothetical protein